MLTAETGYDTYPLRDDGGLLCWHTFHTLRAMGVELPKRFPEELDIDYDRAADEADSDRFWDLLLCRNPYSALIFELYEALNNVYGFYAAYVAPLMNEDRLELDGTAAENIEPGLMNLAGCKIAIREGSAARNFS